MRSRILSLLSIALPFLRPVYAQRQGETASQGVPAPVTVCMYHVEDRDAYFSVAPAGTSSLADKTAAGFPSRRPSWMKTRAIPAAFELSAAFPNPFTTRTQLTLTVASAQRVTVGVFDLLGRRVAQLHDGVLAAGEPHRFTLEAANLPAGLYFIRVTDETFHAVRSASLLR